MANTIMTAKNTFAEGLVMDFAPDNTLATTLTAALNATLLTFNGNEMSLQNDMGNGRVETAYLPEGYVPVGTCEFGDIIYIVSYNPITNKSLIGCFPSPERNISSEEVGGLKNNLKASDFLELSGGLPTGRLVSSSCKKILYLKELNPGDKYIVSSSNINLKTFSDYGNTSNVYGTFPKLLKIHIVAIEDSGKINYLDTTVRWYNKGADSFFIAPSKSDGSGKPDLDAYRSLISSGYSVFQSKVSGKLALLVELEKINSFSCTYDVYTKASKNIKLRSTTPTVTNKNYIVYWSVNWGSDNDNINPKYLVLTKSEWDGKNSINAGKYFLYTKESDNSYKIDYELGKAAETILPTSFYDERGNITSGYWKTELSRQYAPETYTDSFSNFVNRDSYYAKETSVINSLISTLPVYADSVLSKLTVVRDNNGEPTNSYYVNAHHLSKGSYYTAASQGVYHLIEPTSFSDDIVNNYFNTLVYKPFAEFLIPFSQVIDNDTILYPDVSNLIYHYNITPAMPYGLLEEFTLDGYIDFSKIGSGNISLNSWKYYNAENISTLTIGLEVYPESNKGVAEIAIDFYDNQGIAATYRIANKNSYSGLFTEYIPLNGESSSYKLTNIDSTNAPIYHAGILTTDSANLVYKLGNTNYKVIKNSDESYSYIKDGTVVPIIDKQNIYSNDAGILYSNIVYLAKITVKYCSLNALNEFNTSNDADFKEFYRWMWTNTLFNNYYYSVQDFDLLLATLDLDVTALYESTKKWNRLSKLYKPNTIDDDISKNLSALVLAINQDGSANDEGNINAKVIIGLLNTYNTFSIAKSVNDIDYLNKFTLTTVLGTLYIDNTPEKPEILSSNNPIYEYLDSIYPVYDKSIPYNNYGFLNPAETSNNLFKLLDVKIEGTGEELWEKYENYKNRYSLNFTADLGTDNTDVFEYINKNGEVTKINNYIKHVSSKIEDIPLTFTGIHFSKFYKEGVTTSEYLETLVPLVNNIDDLTKYGMTHSKSNNLIEFLNLLAIGNDHKAHNKDRGSIIYVSKYDKSPDNRLFDPSLIVHKSSKEIDIGKSNNCKLGIMKKSSCLESLSLWNVQITSELYLRDLLSSDIGLVLYCDGRRAGLARITRDTDLTLVNVSPKYLENFPSINNRGNLYNYETLVGDNSILGLAMKDINGEIHFLNTFVRGDLYTPGKLGLRLDTLVGKGDEYIAHAVLAILSNIYRKLDSPLNVSVLNIKNIVSLQDNKSVFARDIIYQVDPPKTDNNEVLLMRGIHFSDYIEKVKAYIPINNTDFNNSNVDFKINNILKNIPILLVFNYIQPSKIITDTLGGKMAIRLASQDTYTIIPTISSSYSLYTVNNTAEELTILPALNVNGYNVLSAEISEKTGNVIYKYGNKLHYNNNWGTLFSFLDGHLRLTKTVYDSSELLWVNTSTTNDDGTYIGICGISKQEYITDYLKYTY